MTLQEKFKDKVLFIKDEQMFEEVTELLKGVGAEFDFKIYFLSEKLPEANYLQTNSFTFGLAYKLKFHTELTYEQFKELLGKN